MRKNKIIISTLTSLCAISTCAFTTISCANKPGIGDLRINKINGTFSYNVEINEPGRYAVLARIDNRNDFTIKVENNNKLDIVVDYLNMFDATTKGSYKITIIPNKEIRDATCYSAVSEVRNANGLNCALTNKDNGKYVIYAYTAINDGNPAIVENANYIDVIDDNNAPDIVKYPCVYSGHDDASFFFTSMLRLGTNRFHFSSTDEVAPSMRNQRFYFLAKYKDIPSEGAKVTLTTMLGTRAGRLIGKDLRINPGEKTYIFIEGIKSDRKYSYYVQNEEGKNIPTRVYDNDLNLLSDNSGIFNSSNIDRAILECSPIGYNYTIVKSAYAGEYREIDDEQFSYRFDVNASDADTTIEYHVNNPLYFSDFGGHKTLRLYFDTVRGSRFLSKVLRAEITLYKANKSETKKVVLSDFTSSRYDEPEFIVSNEIKFSDSDNYEGYTIDEFTLRYAIAHQFKDNCTISVSLKGV